MSSLIRLRLPFYLFVFFFVLCVGASAQITIHVPADKSSIQAAIDSASNGDTVLVSPGTYKERIDFKGKNITVTSQAGAQQTIIDGQSGGSVVSFHTAETGSAIFSGFTVQHGKSTSGAGINIYGANPIIEHNIITDNNCATGGGIYSSFASATIRYNTIFHNNRAADCHPSGIGGGGVTIGGTGATKLLYNLIYDNLGGYQGGGVSMWAADSAIVEGNIIRSNASTGSTGGGLAIANDGGSVIRYNVITSNTGGGVQWVSVPASFIGNTVAGNDDPTGTAASALYAATFGSIDMRNNLLVAKFGQIAINCSSGSITSPSLFANNDAFSNGGLTYKNCSSQTGLNGNISIDPQFANEAAGNFHLATGSPVLDIADSTVPYIPTTDVDSNPRLVDGGSGTAKLDLGGYEYQGMTTMGVTPDSLAYVVQKINTVSASQAVSVTNTGARALHLKAANIGADFLHTNNCELPDGLPAGQNCSYAVSFKPRSAGDKLETIVVAGANVSGQHSTTLTGTGSTPIMSLSTTSLTFGDQLFGTTSAPQGITVNNIGDADLVIANVSVTGTEFKQFNNCGVVPAGGACIISVTFAPIATRTRTASLTITDDAAGSPHQVNLTGNGTGPEIAFSPTHLDFLPQPIGTIGNPIVLTVSNPSVSDLSITSIAISGDFTQTNNCPPVLLASTSCQVSVTNKPSFYGSTLGVLTFTDNAALSPQSVPLSGTGTAPLAYRSPTFLQFPGPYVVGTTSAQQSVLYQNVGNAPLSINSIAASGDFSQTNACPQLLLPTEYCYIYVNFAPAASGARIGAITISDNAAGSPRMVSLSGNAIDVYPVPTLSTLSKEASEITSNSTTVTLTGAGFFSASVVYWDAQPLPTTFVSSTSLTATITASLLSTYGEHKITVFNPLPGGGSSTATTFTVYRSIRISAHDLLYDPYRRVFYASIAGAAPAYPNTLMTIDPATGLTIGTPLFIGSEPNRLALSDDGQFLYVGLNGAHSIKRLNLYTNQVDLEIQLGSDSIYGPYSALEIAVVPGAPHSIAVALGTYNTSPVERGIKIYDDAVARPNWQLSSGVVATITFMDDPAILYGTSAAISPPSLFRMKVDATGITTLASQLNAGGGTELRTDGSRLYNFSKVWDPANLTQLGQFTFLTLFPTSIYPERGVNRVYLLEAISDGTGNNTMFWAADKTFLQVGHRTLPVPYAYTSRLQRWGSDGLAFRSYSGSPSSGGTNANDQVVLLRTSLTNPSPGNNPTAAITTLTPAATEIGSANFLLKVTGSGFVPGAVVQWNGAERTTTFVSATELQAYISAADVATGSNVTVTAVNPASPASNQAAFRVGLLQVSSDALNFGTQLKSSTSYNRAVTVTNLRPVAVGVTGISVSGDFLQSNDCGSQLAPSASCSVLVAFHPGSVATLNGTLTITTDQAEPARTVALSGLGISVTITPSRPLRLTRGAGNASSSSSLTETLADILSGLVIDSSAIVKHPLRSSVNSAPNAGANPAPAQPQLSLAAPFDFSFLFREAPPLCTAVSIGPDRSLKSKIATSCWTLLPTLTVSDESDNKEKSAREVDGRK